MICEIVGVPDGDRQQIRHWTDAMLEREVGNPFPTDHGIECAIKIGGYMDALAADKRNHLGDDMISHLLEAEVEREDGTIERLTDVEVARFVMLLTAAGAETVTKLVGNAVMTFGENPDELAKLKADPSLAGSAVEEVLRYKAPSQYQGRFSTADRELPRRDDPRRVPGARSSPAPPTATSAPTTTPTASTSSAPGPLGIAFGHGIHYCIGAHLARLEGKTAFNELYRRWPNLQVDQAGIKYVHMANVAGPSSVPVTVLSSTSGQRRSPRLVGGGELPVGVLDVVGTLLLRAGSPTGSAAG